MKMFKNRQARAWVRQAERPLPWPLSDDGDANWRGPYSLGMLESARDLHHGLDVIEVISRDDADQTIQTLCSSLAHESADSNSLICVSSFVCDGDAINHAECRAGHGQKRSKQHE